MPTFELEVGSVRLFNPAHVLRMTIAEVVQAFARSVALLPFWPALLSCAIPYAV